MFPGDDKYARDKVRIRGMRVQVLIKAVPITGDD